MENKKPQEEPRRRDPSSWYGQTCNKCHLSRTQHDNNNLLKMYKTSMRPKVCGIYKSGCMGNLVIQTQVYSVGPQVNTVHVARSELC